MTYLGMSQHRGREVLEGRAVSDSCLLGMHTPRLGTQEALSGAG